MAEGPGVGGMACVEEDRNGGQNGRQGGVDLRPLPLPPPQLLYKIRSSSLSSTWG